MSRKLVTAPSTTYTHPEGYVIALPLQPKRGLRRLHRQQVRSLKREISQALSAGHWVRDPLTGKPIQIYRHSIFRSQVRTLERLREISDEMKATYVHIKHFSGRRDGSFAKLALWGLIKPMREAKLHDHEASDGRWMITKEGREFLAGGLAVPRQMAVLLGVNIGPVDASDLITVSQVPDKFEKEEHLTGKPKDVA